MNPDYVDSLIKKLNTDEDMQALLSEFVNNDGYYIGLIKGGSSLNFIELWSIIDYVLNTAYLDYSPSLESEVMSVVKYFYLMANIAYLVQRDLILKKQLRYKNKSLEMSHDQGTYSQSEIKKNVGTIYDMDFVINLEPSHDRFSITFEKSFVRPAELSLDFALSVYVEHLDMSTTVLIKPTDINKTFLNDLINQI